MKLGFRDGAFDAAVAPYVLTVVPDPESVLDEIARVVRPGGEIVLVNHIGAERGLRAMIEAWLGKRSAALGWRPEFPWAILDRWLARRPDITLLERRALAPFGLFTLDPPALRSCIRGAGEGGRQSRPDENCRGSVETRGIAGFAACADHESASACPLLALEKGANGRTGEWTLAVPLSSASLLRSPSQHHQEVIPMHFDRPEGKPDEKIGWGSNVAAAMLRRFGFPYVSLNPGASYRGLHDSIVNHLGNETPSMVLCLHEDHAVAIAHGYAKATGEPMACILHSNVGLMHGMMSLYNAWCDRVPMFVLGATGPVNSAQRRPWIDWISIKELLGHDDIDVTVATTGAEALAAADEQPFDCMVLDLRLPDMSGFEVLERLRDTPSLTDLPVVVFTGQRAFSRRGCPPPRAGAQRGGQGRRVAGTSAG